MKPFKLILFIAFLLAICIFTECTNRSKEVPNETKYYETTPVPPYVVEKLGPFGPQEKTYPVPEGAIIVAPDGLDTNDGSSVKKTTSLEKAIENATTGAVIVLRGGEYRTGDLTFNKKITIQPYLSEKPIIKGSKVASEWAKKGDYWVTKWDGLTPYYNDKPCSLNVMGDHYYGDLVMVNGEMLRAVDKISELESGKFYCDYTANEVYLFDDPSEKLIEISVYDNGFVRVHDETADIEGPTIQGLDMMHFRISCITIQKDNPHEVVEPGEMPFAPVKSRVENCRLLFCAKYGLVVTSPYSYIGYNDISVIGYVAVEPFMSHNGVFEHNTVTNSNWFNFRTFPAGIKVFNQSSNYIVRNNNFSDMPCGAIWYDVGHRDGVVVNNYVCNSSHFGVKVEISHRTYIAGNVFKNAKLWLCNAHDCEVYNNTLIDTRIELWRNNRGIYTGRGNYHAATGPGPLNYHGHKVANNVFASEKDKSENETVFTEGYFLIEDNSNFGEEIVDKNFQADIISNNLFLKNEEWTFNAEFQPKKLPFTEYASLEDFRKDYGEFEEGNVQLDIEPYELFESKDMGDFSLKNVPGIPVGKELPDSIAKFLGWDPVNPGLGAFAQTK